MTKRLLITLLILFNTLGIDAQQPPVLMKAQPLPFVNIPAADSILKKYSLISFTAEDITVLATTNTYSLQLTVLPGMTWNIELSPSKIKSSQYQLLLITENGLQQAPSNPAKFYSGSVQGYNESTVTMTVGKNSFSGSFFLDNNEYFIEPLAVYDASAKNNSYIFYKLEDVITPSNFRCIITEPEKENKLLQQNLVFSARPASPATSLCYKIPVVLMTDYQMLQQFHFNIDSLETFLLGNMNYVQNVFSNFNFDPNNPFDEGSDNLELEVINCIISTCSNCNIISDLTEGTNLLRELTKKVTTDFSYPFFHITNFWTPRNLYSVSQEISGTSSGLVNRGNANPPAACDYLGANILKYPVANTALLRLIAAHEMGHNLECQHDNELNPVVTQFIMNSYPASPPGSRFSTLNDFGSGDYSSGIRIKQAVNKIASCTIGCNTANTCTSLTGVELSQTIVTTDSVKISWNENISCRVTLVKLEKDSTLLLQQKDITGSKAIFGGIESCNKYQVQVWPLCGAVAGRGVSFPFSSAPLAAIKINTALSGNYYELTMHLEGRIGSENLKIFIDNFQVSFYYNAEENSVIVKNLFADGRRHRVELKNKFSEDTCRLLYQYAAPYGRQLAATLLLADFNQCSSAPGWSDTLFDKYDLPGYRTGKWHYSAFTIPNVYTLVGTIDSSCMMYYNIFSPENGCCGSLQVTSPPADLTGYRNAMLSFDYVFYAARRNMLASKSGFLVEVFNGLDWVKVFERKNDLLLIPPFFLKNVWDTLPPRVFIPVDPYRNKNFRVRLTIHDGLVNDSGQLVTARFIAAFDNIRVDAYPLLEGGSNNEFTVYPNPASGSLYISLNVAMNRNILYTIFDNKGTAIQKGKLLDNIIRLNNLATGIYFLQLKSENGIAYKPAKVLVFH